ncbi:hypothetical protein [Fibrella aquatilis]|uniref:Uncharacterized protein n=1 Tax=Fibrella aquatilis TaxID=2817059 RepID=A0A939GAG3_9BACT|nr:hypothetical protein [Fibrella aquatilis]MBO0933047.1 hypothetical protein [Fibrella aquatilis]
MIPHLPRLTQPPPASADRPGPLLTKEGAGAVRRCGWYKRKKPLGCEGLSVSGGEEYYFAESDAIDDDMAEVDSAPVAIVVSIDDVADESIDMVDVESEVVVDVVSAFFSQLVARARIDNTNRADFAKPFMILCV